MAKPADVAVGTGALQRFSGLDDASRGAALEARAAEYFERFLSACEGFAHANDMGQPVAGVNTSRHDAYRLMLRLGFKPMLQGVAMQLGNTPGHNRAECFVIDDWR